MKLLLTLVLIYLNLIANDINISLSVFADRVSKQINKNIYIDEDLNSSISLYVPEKISNRDLFSIFKKSVYKSGFTLTLRGNTYYLSSNYKEPIKAYIYKLKYDSFDDCKLLLDSLSSKYKYLVNNNLFIINSTKKEFKNISELLLQVDTKQKQVILKIIIFEYNDNSLRDVGLQFGSTYSDISGSTQTAINSLIASVSSGSVSIPSSSFYTALKFLDSNEFLFVKQFPFILAKNNRNFEFSAVTNTPFLITTTTTDSTNTTEQNSIDYKDVGLKIVGKSLIHEDYVSLKLDLILEDFLTNIETQTPSTYKRSIKSDTDIKYHNVLLISGLKRQKHTKNVYALPFFSNIPYIGEIFKYKNTSDEELNLTVAIEIINEDDIGKFSKSVNVDFKNYIKDDSKDILKDFINAEDDEMY
jgi:general secretion pathway protein D